MVNAGLEIRLDLIRRKKHFASVRPFVQLKSEGKGREKGRREGGKGSI